MRFVCGRSYPSRCHRNLNQPTKCPVTHHSGSELLAVLSVNIYFYLSYLSIDSTRWRWQSTVHFDAFTVQNDAKLLRAGQNQTAIIRRKSFRNIQTFWPVHRFCTNSNVQTYLSTDSPASSERTLTEVLLCDLLLEARGLLGDLETRPETTGHTLFFVAVIYGAPSVTATSFHHQVCVHGKTRHELLSLSGIGNE